MKDLFISHIHSRKKLKLTFYSKEDGHNLTRLCAPMDYASSSRAKDKTPRFHFWDFESDTKNHTLSLLDSQIISIEPTNISFNPSEFITWSTNWTIKRDWGVFS